MNTLGDCCGSCVHWTRGSASDMTAPEGKCGLETDPNFYPFGYWPNTLQSDKCRRFERTTVGGREVKLNITEARVLHHLATECGPERCPSSAVIAFEADLSMLAAKRAIKSLHRRELAVLHRVFDDDGMCAGSGYEITDAGRAALAEQKDRER